MPDAPVTTCTAFVENRRLATGPRDEVAAALWQATARGLEGRIFVFDDRTGRPIDLERPGAAVARAPTDERDEDEAGGAGHTPQPRGRGRPRLGVIAREVTLLPRHWEWLAEQPGGASVALRRLVEAARRNDRAAAQGCRQLEAAYHFITAIAGDLPRYEEATRALFAKDAQRFGELVAGWPGDVPAHALQLGFGAGAAGAQAAPAP